MNSEEISHGRPFAIFSETIYLARQSETPDSVIKKANTEIINTNMTVVFPKPLEIYWSKLVYPVKLIRIIANRLGQIRSTKAHSSTVPI